LFSSLGVWLRVDSVGEISPVVRDLPEQAQPEASGLAATISRNIVASLARVLVVSLVALVLPAYLTHRLPVTTYAAWVLILQLGAYVSYLDLGIQIGVSKFVAEHESRGDNAGASRHASAGLALMLAAGILGVGLAIILAWQVPRLFSTMPANLYHEVRTSLLLVGSSLSFGLVCAVHSAVFQGLQRYWIPMMLSIVNRALYAAIVIAVVALHGNLVAMGSAVALVNVATGAMQVIAWRKRASHVALSFRLVEFGVLKDVTRFCSLQSIWTIAMLCITGLDIAIVGHYDYVQTAYYSIATLPTNFMLMIAAAVIGPIVPASSAISTQRSPVEMGDFLARITRYGAVTLLLTALPLLVYGFVVLRVWVGPEYAIHTIRYLRILILANVIRNLCAPYAAMVVGTGRQGAGILTAVSEAIVNLGSSLYLASRYGAIGVAIGTLIGSFVSVGLHFLVTMPLTHRTLTISPSRLFLKGFLQPSVIVIPSVVLVALGWSSTSLRLSQAAAAAAGWALSTGAVTWFGALNDEERSDLTRLWGRWRRLLRAA
jgi:O-antigen/teichoic acid export membrane protein